MAPIRSLVFYRGASQTSISEEASVGPLSPETRIALWEADRTCAASFWCLAEIDTAVSLLLGSSTDVQTIRIGSRHHHPRLRPPSARRSPGQRLTVRPLYRRRRERQQKSLLMENLVLERGMGRVTLDGAARVSSACRSRRSPTYTVTASRSPTTRCGFVEFPIAINDGPLQRRRLLGWDLRRAE